MKNAAVVYELKKGNNSIARYMIAASVSEVRAIEKTIHPGMLVVNMRVYSPRSIKMGMDGKYLKGTDLEFMCKAEVYDINLELFKKRNLLVISS